MDDEPVVYPLIERRPFTLPGTGEEMTYEYRQDGPGQHSASLTRKVTLAELEDLYRRLFPNSPTEIPNAFLRNLQSGGTGKTRASMSLDNWPGAVGPLEVDETGIIHHRPHHINLVDPGPTAERFHQQRARRYGRGFDLTLMWMDEHLYLEDPPHHPDYQAPPHDCETGPAPYDTPGHYVPWAHARHHH